MIYRLNSRIVITTNFDKIYETFCTSTSTDGYKVVPYYSPSLADNLRSEVRIIIKAHGTIDDHQQMIFTRHQYHEAKKNHQAFYEILKAILLTNTCVFIGCGMEDPDVMLLLEDVKSVGTGTRPHYAIIKSGSQDKFVLQDWDRTYNVKSLSYDGSHEQLLPELEGLFLDVDALRKIHKG